MTQNTTQQQPKPQEKKPNDAGLISVEGHVRIFDPNTKKTIVETRG